MNNISFLFWTGIPAIVSFIHFIILFVSSDEEFDAKYKRLDNKDNESIDRNDKHQIVSYAYTLNAKKAGFIYPLEEFNYSNENKITKIGVLNNAYNSYADCGIY